MLRPIALLVVSIFAASSLAVAAPPTHTVVAEDGVRLEYTVKLDDGELIRFKGRALDSREPFSLIVQSNGRVTGKVGQRRVNFTIEQTRRDKLVASLRARQALAVARSEFVPASRASD